MSALFGGAAPLTLAATLASLLALGCGATPPRATERAHVVSIEHRSRMGAFRLVGIRVVLDGAEVAHIDRDAPDGDAGASLPSIETPLCLLAQPIASGAHTLDVDLTYAGSGYGVFAYIQAYRFHARATQAFDVPADDEGVAVTTTGWEMADVALEDRPRVRVDVAVAQGPADHCAPE